MIVIGWPLGTRFTTANAVANAYNVPTWWEAYLALFSTLVELGFDAREATRLALGELRHPEAPGQTATAP